MFWGLCTVRCDTYALLAQPLAAPISCSVSPNPTNRLARWCRLVWSPQIFLWLRLCCRHHLRRSIWASFSSSLVGGGKWGDPGELVMRFAICGRARHALCDLRIATLLVTTSTPAPVAPSNAIVSAITNAHQYAFYIICASATSAVGTVTRTAPAAFAVVNLPYGVSHLPHSLCSCCAEVSVCDVM